MNEETLDFTPVTFDASELPPEAAEGSYDATLKIKVMKTAQDGYPMIVAEWHLDAADTGDQNSVGADVADFLPLFPKGHKAYKMSVLRVRGLLDFLGLEADIIPTDITSKDDFKAFIEAADGKTGKIWVSSKADKRNGGQLRTAIAYTAPRGTLPEPDEVVEAPAARGKSNGNGAGTVGKNGKAAAGKKNGKR